MTSPKPRIFTYHVAPTSTSPLLTEPSGSAPWSRTSSSSLAPLNRKGAEYKPVPDDEIHTPTLQTGFHAARKQLLLGRLGVWAEALGRGGHASAGGEWSNNETFSCDSIVTTCFDPTDEWVTN